MSRSQCCSVLKNLVLLPPLVSTGLYHDEVCHLDTCPVGIATQNPELRKKFEAVADVVNFMHFIAQEMREHMAKLGFRTVNEMVGRSDRLEARRAVEHWKAKGLDYAAILYQPEGPARCWPVSPNTAEPWTGKRP